MYTPVPHICVYSSMLKGPISKRQKNGGGGVNVIGHFPFALILHPFFVAHRNKLSAGPSLALAVLHKKGKITLAAGHRPGVATYFKVRQKEIPWLFGRPGNPSKRCTHSRRNFTQRTAGSVDFERGHSKRSAYTAQNLLFFVCNAL